MTIEKPKSMTSGQRNIIRPNDSASLWNCTLVPGWTREESDILRKALMKFGIGNWKEVMEAGVLPGKTNAQLNLQLQRLLGQQSTAEFQGLHIDPAVIGEKNSSLTGDHIKRKNGFIVNTGGKLSRPELLKRIQQNKELYEISEEEWTKIELPVTAPVPENVIIQEKQARLFELEKQLRIVEQEIKERLEYLQNNIVEKDRLNKS
ncbi:hypothetical protein HDV06_004336 [Boothiomyces sp. JEL0866]|nr:hypothetical protein HDV06_004336 [Boothiomyces sp. JEL0866]